MNNNITKEYLSALRNKYEDACNAYLTALLNIWELDSFYGFWIGDEVGGVYAYGDSIFIIMDDIIFCVEYAVSKDTFTEYSDYCLKCNEYGFSVPNLPSYFKGCPKVPQETFDRLDGLKRELDKCISETKSKF